MALPPLKQRITADTSDFDKKIGGAAKGMAKFAAAAAAAVAAAVGALAALGRQQAKIIDQNTKMARSLGLTHDQFNTMSFVAGEAGVEIGKLSSSLGLMQRNIVELQKGTATQTQAFDRLGLSIRDLQGLSPDQQFETIAAALNNVDDAAVRTATAMDIFGRSGREVINMLDGYGAAAEEARQFQEKFGLSVSQLDARSIERANDAMGRIGQAIRGVGNMIATYTAPLITRMADALLDSGIDAETFRKIGERAMAIVGAGVDIVRVAILGMRVAWNLAEAAVAKFAAVSLRVLQPVAQAVDAIMSALGQESGLAGRIEGAVKSLDDAASEAFGDAKSSANAIKNFENTADAIRRIRQEVLDEIDADGSILDRAYGTESGFEGGEAPSGAGGGAGAGASSREGSVLERLDTQLTAQEERIRAHMQTIRSLTEGGLSDRLGAWGDYFSQLQSLTMSSNNRLLKIGQSFNAAMALIDSYRAFTLTLSDPSLPWYARIAAAGQVLAAGIGAVNSIKSISSGGSSSRAGSAGSAGSSAQSVINTQRVDLNIIGGTDRDRMVASTIIDTLNDAQRDGFRLDPRLIGVQ